MRKIFIAFGLFICFTAANAHAQQPQVAQWPRFSSPEGRFSILLPGRPLREDQTKETPVGRVEMHIFTSRTEGGIYVVAYADYAFGDAKRELDANRDSFLKGMKATLLSESDINIKGNPGREINAWREQLTIRTRMYLVGKRYYQMFVIVPTPQAVLEDTNRFFNSFELVEAPSTITK